jgi:hypothetical protein
MSRTKKITNDKEQKMQILALSKTKEGVTPDQIGQHGKNEIQHTLEGYLDGKIRNFWFRKDVNGIVFILECTDEDEARRIMEELPLVVAGLMDFDLIPLQPLGTLIGREMAL